LHPRARGRTWPQRLIIMTGCVVISLCVGAASVAAYLGIRYGQINRVEGIEVQEQAAGEPANFLLVGTDSREGLDENDPDAGGFLGDSGCDCTDTIMVLRVDPRDRSAQILSFPRDLWVPIAETDSDQRLNAALATGGPERLIQTIDEDFGIPIHHYVQVDFAGFRELVDVVGGVAVSFPRPARSELAGLSIETAGCYTLGPLQALGFARARKDYQVQDADGDWHQDPRSDFSRVERQQLFIRLALRQAIIGGLRNPNTLRRLIDLGVGTVRVDDALEVGSLASLGLRFRNFGPDDLVTHTLPVVDDVIGGMEVLRLIEDQAEPTLAIFRGVAPADPSAVEPADVSVQVQNGTGSQGQGGEAADGLIGLGFTITGTGDADELGLPTTVRFVPGGEAEAQLVARSVAGPVAYERADGLGGADAVLITGTDWEGIAPAVRSIQDVPGPTAAVPDTTTTSGPVDGSSTTAVDGSSTTGLDTGSTTTTTTAPVDSDDPDDPGFFLAREPGPDEDCPATD
ncbi:MAG TPA: LCP family protein, partial [Iamia sp.]|nr:LCP family protein [Iamia sp.]